jgi:hypothetical protein
VGVTAPDIQWRRVERGKHVAACEGQQVAVVEGSYLQRWRYRIGAGEWSDEYGTVMLAKRRAGEALERLRQPPPR